MTDGNLPPPRHRSRPGSSDAMSPCAGEAAVPDEVTTPALPDPAETARQPEAVGSDPSSGNWQPAFPFPATFTDWEEGPDLGEVERYFLDALQPQGGMEEALVYSIVDQTREIQRLEGARLAVLRLQVSDQLKALLEPTVSMAERITPGFSLATIVEGWALNVPEHVDSVKARLARINFTEQAIIGKAYALALDRVEKLNTLIEKAERRRDRTLRAIDHLRAARDASALRKLQLERARMLLDDERAARDPGLLSGEASRYDETDG